MFASSVFLYRLAVAFLTAGLFSCCIQTTRAFTISAFGTASDPVVISGQALSGGTMVLRWTGGHGPFLVQGKGQVTDASWVDLLRTGERTAQVPVSDPVALLRVLDLGASADSLKVASLSASSALSILNNSGNGFAGSCRSMNPAATFRRIRAARPALTYTSRRSIKRWRFTAKAPELKPPRAACPVSCSAPAAWPERIAARACQTRS